MQLWSRMFAGRSTAAMAVPQQIVHLVPFDALEYMALSQLIAHFDDFVLQAKWLTEALAEKNLSVVRAITGQLLKKHMYIQDILSQRTTRRKCRAQHLQLFID